MSQRTLGILQWVGLLLGAGVWAAQHLVGLGITQAACGPNGSTWGVQNDVWQGALMGVALASRPRRGGRRGDRLRADRGT